VICVFNIPAITWTLTAVLMLGGTWHAIQAIRPVRGIPGRRSTDRINQALHALMHTLMAAMLWNAAPGTMLAQILILGAAALWFIIQAVARPEFRTFCTGTSGRITCAYHALSMAAGALMIAMMSNHTTTPGTAPAATSSAAHTGHHGTTAAHAKGAVVEHSPVLALALTVLFAAAALVFLALFLRRRRATGQQKHSNHQRSSHGRSNHGLEALGAGSMAAMFAAMTA
jgi:hypothetical protein